MVFKKLLLFLLIGFTLTACAQRDSSSLAFLTKTVTPLPSSTVIWFPVSITPSPQTFSTYTATPEMRPGLGSAFITDNFTKPQLWNSATSEDAYASLADNALNISVQPNIYYINLRQGLAINNFYAEITARAHLCRNDDEYGFLVRANAVAYYRFALSCNGQAHAERISVNEKHPLQESVYSADVPRGAPGEVTIGVWALGNEMRLFLNGHFQFSIVDQNYSSGTIGVFVHAASKDTPVTISFTDLIIQEITLSPPTRTPRP